MGASSTRKGKVGEREWANWLRSHLGATVSRGQQGGGGHNDPDVKGLAGWWCEVKRVERFSVWKVLETLLDDWLAGATRHDKPMVAFRRNRGKWWVILRAEDWAGLLTQVDEVSKENPRVKPILGALGSLSDDDFRDATTSDKLAGVEQRAAYREEKLRSALKMGDDLVAHGAEKYREKCARLAEVEAERDQARCDAGIWERRVREAAETVEVLAFSAEKEAEVAKRYISELETRNRAMAAELKRTAR